MADRHVTPRAHLVIDTNDHDRIKRLRESLETITKIQGLTLRQTASRVIDLAESEIEKMLAQQREEENPLFYVRTGNQELPVASVMT